MNSQSPKEVLLTSPLLHSQGGASTVLQHSHDKFKSVFDVTMAASKGGGKRSLMAGEVAGHRRRLSCPSEVHPVSLLFDNQLHEDCFVIRFYSPNRNSALVGLFVLAMILVIASSIDLNLPRLDVPIFRVSLIIAASLSVASFVTASVNAAVHRNLLFLSSNRKTNDIEVVKKDRLMYHLSSWWEVSLVLAHLATIVWSFNLNVAKSVGCLGSNELDDPINDRICSTTLQFDGLLMVPIIFQGVVFPVRWFLHVPVSISIVVAFFGMRFLPQIPLSVTDLKLLMTSAFVFGIPIVVSAVVRFLRERELRQLLLKELQLEATFHQLNVLTARHETLLTPWVPLPAEEQVKLLRSALHGSHLWGLGNQTIVGMVHFGKFSSWVAKSGASEACRALCKLVDAADKYYELISPLSDSMLKCHIDGDHYLLVCPDRADGGFLLIIALLACQEVSSAEFSGNDEYECGTLEACAAVTSGLLGVAGIAASGTLAPAGPAMTRLLAVSRGCNSSRSVGPRLTVTSDTLRYMPHVPLHSSCALTFDNDDAPINVENVFHVPFVSLLELGNAQHFQPLEYVPAAKRQQLLHILGDNAPLLLEVAVPVTVIPDGPQIEQQTFLPSLLFGASSTTSERFRHLASQLHPPPPTGDVVFSAAESVASASTHLLLPALTKRLDSSPQNAADRAIDYNGNSALQHPQEQPSHFSPASSIDRASKKPPQLKDDVAKNSNFSTSRSCFLLVHETFVDKDVEHRFMRHAAHHVAKLDLLVASVASFAMGLFLVIICVVYETTSMEVPGPMSCSVAAMSFGILLTAVSVVHVRQLLVAEAVLVAHEFLFWCFDAAVIGTVYTGQPNTSPLGDTQLVWMFMLVTINFVRPRAHGVLPHVSLDMVSSIAFFVLACIHTQHTPLMRKLNIVCAVAVGFAPLYLHSCLDNEERQKFVTETCLEELQHNLILKNGEINKLLAHNRANNPAAIFAARAQRVRQASRYAPHQLMPQSPLIVDNVDPSTSTTIASRAIDSPLLVVEFQTVVPSSTTLELKHSVTTAKAFVEAIESLISLQFFKLFRVVKATSTSLLILPSASVVGQGNGSADTKDKTTTEIHLVQLGVEIVWKLCPQHHIIGRAVVDSGVMMGVLLGTSSMSFEFTGPVIERAKCLVDAAVWGHVFVSKRVLRYCGISTKHSLDVVTAGGLVGELDLEGWMPWRVGAFPLIAMNVVIQGKSHAAIV
ncbi:GPI-anchored surface protein, putative [Bodo saltans]|uniref:GPI-anchored surface protein, putative n=1 Tax=Bodo saltans TaxID=75058 RepID=A0A0S4IRN6_BODSA|nr:GPI-anchored surface protein, putative [Bodo saltans]|eukprot:CUG02961.1 GPI-anchored surface protein, putative [Bodo saltans]